MTDIGYKLKLKRGLEAVKAFAKRSADLRQLSLLGLIETNFASLEIVLTKKGETKLGELQVELSGDFNRSSLSGEELLYLPDVQLYHEAKNRADDVAVLGLKVFDRLYNWFYQDWLESGYFELDGELLTSLTEKQLLGQDTSEQLQELFLSNFLDYFKENWEAELEKYKRDNV